MEVILFPYVSSEQISRAREVSLLSYLQRHEPDNLVHVSGGEYCTREHDSLRISNGKWLWRSQGIGGLGALDYLLKVKSYSFPDAVLMLIGDNFPYHARAPDLINSPKPNIDKKPFSLPPCHSDSRRVFAYLCKRGIDPEIINHCIKHGHVYEDAKHHNAVFVGKDKDGNARYAALRGTLSHSNFKGEAPGSDKSIGFSIQYSHSGTLCVYESAIDLLSFLTMQKKAGIDWRTGAHLSLGGVAAPGKNTEAFKLPPALKRYLEDYPNFSTVALFLDNDQAGRSAAKSITLALTDRTVIDRFPKEAKDLNELLQQLLKAEQRAKSRAVTR